METKRTLKPVNQKSIYHSYADIYERLMNDEIPVEKGESAMKALDGMNRTYALEIKRAEVENALKGNMVQTNIRSIELKDFESATE